MPDLEKTKKKSNYSNPRNLNHQNQQKKMKTLIWLTISCFIAIAAIILIVNIKSNPVQFAYDKLPVLGDPKAPVKIVEFGDYKCPSCQYFSQQIEPQLKKEYIDTGIASLYFMDFTIIGPDSYTAALAAHSIYHQSNESYWKYYDAIYKNQGDEKVQWATPEFLTDLARKQNIAVDYDKMLKEIQSRAYASEVDENNNMAKKAGVSGTPTLFINGKKFENAFDYNALKTAIENARKGDK